MMKQINVFKSMLLSAMCAGACATAQAEEYIRPIVCGPRDTGICITSPTVEFKGVVGIGYDFGGDLLMSGTYTNGSTWEVKANQGLTVNGGVVMVTGAFETQATVGYKFGGPQAQNGSVTFSVVSLELMEFYRTGNIRAGLGLSYLSNPKLKVDIPGSILNGTYNFNNTLGTVAQIGWAPADNSFTVDFRYTVAKLQMSNVANARDINANVAGIYGSFRF